MNDHEPRDDPFWTPNTIKASLLVAFITVCNYITECREDRRKARAARKARRRRKKAAKPGKPSPGSA